MKKVCLVCMFALSLFIMVSVAQAGLVINNGLPNGTYGNELTQAIQAEDFSFIAPQTINAVRFWAFPDVKIEHGQYLGNITWQLYRDNAGQPGVMFASGNVIPTQTLYGNTLSWGPDYEFDFDIPQQNLAAGTYWLALHNGPLTESTRLAFFWETTNNNGTSLGQEDIAPFDGVWASNGYEHAFQLYNNAAPIPGAVWLLGSGLLSLVGLRKSRKG
jgi:hypothetical protein